MSTSDKTIEQVKSILGRLDRCIDAAREKRLHGSNPAAAALPTQPFRDVSQQQIGAERPGPTPPPPSATPPSPGSKFGRAQPLRLDDRPRF